MSFNAKVNDRRRGAMIGLAVGDALGAAVEFCSPGSFTPVNGYRGGGPFDLAAGEWTDDTSMALALAHSLGETAWNLTDQLDRYVDWWQNGKYSVTGKCFDIGNTTRAALMKFRDSRDPKRSGITDESSSGNGSIMRLAPVPIFFTAYYPDMIEELERLAAESSKTTHSSSQCLSACRYMALVLAALMKGVTKEEVLSEDWWALEKIHGRMRLDPAIYAVAKGSFKEKQPPSIRGSGWVVESLEAALWAFWRSDTFEEAVLNAVNLGDDADTTGAVCGQIAGACWGESAIPEPLRQGLARHDMLEEALSSIMKEPLDVRRHERGRIRRLCDGLGLLEGKDSSLLSALHSVEFGVPSPDPALNVDLSDVHSLVYNLVTTILDIDPQTEWEEKCRQAKEKLAKLRQETGK